MEDQLDIHTISQRHVRGIDKFYRMYAGLSSELLSYESGVIELEIRRSARWPKPPEETAAQLAECWRGHNEELADAVAFLVHIYERKTDPGFFLPTDSLKGAEGAAILAKKIRETVNVPADILIATVRGRFDQPES